MDQIAVATIDRATGLLSAGEPAVFPGNFSGSCQLMSSSTTKFYCYDGTRIRVCTTSAGSPRFVCTGAYTLSPPLPPAAECNPTEPCYGGTFAFDGAYFYFAADQGNDQSRDYVVYDATGTLVNTFTATGTGAINGVYFDWSAGRYSTHDGFGNRTGALVFGEAGSDTHNFSPVAETHLLWAP
jgi:hypothetical protein